LSNLPEPTTSNHVCIIGAGLAGLTAAYDLGRQGYQVTLLEAASDIGGLASSIMIDGRPIEQFYHFICMGDRDLISMVAELGLQDKLHWQESRTSFYYYGDLFSFGTPFDLLLFKPVPFFQRIRFGLNVIESRYRKNWEPLDKVGARSWLISKIGQRAYDVIWDPLLRVKFGEYHEQISAAWIWHRINRVASSRRHMWERDRLGYLEYGSETVIPALAERIKAMPNIKVRTGVRVERVVAEDGHVTGVKVGGDASPTDCDAVISTIALAVLFKIAPDLPEDYRKAISAIDYIGVVCGLLKLKRPVTNAFWTNINDPDIPFNGIIEYSNLNHHVSRDLGGKSVAYIPYYLRTSDPRFSFDDDQLRREFIDGIKRVNPAFDESWVEECHISRAPFAQAICTVGFKDQVPDHQSPLAGLYITDSTQFYPEDRTISAAIRLGRRVATMIIDRDTAAAVSA
jgi:protoporphyrinogen oxidase